MPLSWPQRKNWSISFRLAVWYTGTLLVILTGFATLTYLNFHNSLHRDFDEHLNHEHRNLIGQVSSIGDEVKFRNPDNIRIAAYTTQGVYGTYVRLIDSQGRIVFTSPNFEGHEHLALMLPEEHIVSKISTEWEDAPLRIHYAPLLTSDGTLKGWLEISGYEWSLHQEINRLMQTFLIGILLTGLFTLFGGIFLAKKTLEPIAEITRTANEIDLSRLDIRIPMASGVHDELSELGATLNRLFDRIQESILRERRFSANAAHELVTPLATLRAEMELLLGSSDSSADTKKAIEHSIEDIDRIEHVIRSLLMLSAAERVGDHSQSRLNISEICADHLRRFEDRAQVEGIRLVEELSPRLFVKGNDVGLGTVLDNLLDNALKYSPRGTAVLFKAFQEGKQIVILVKDEGVGISPEDVRMIFDRFFRAKTSEIQLRKGSGLGLSIALAIVRSMKGQLSVHSDGVGQGSQFEVRFPVA